MTHSSVAQDNILRFRSTSPDNRLLFITRLLAALIVPVLLVAFLMLYFFPQHSGLLFAWSIKPSMNAMMLGAAYLGGAYFFHGSLLHINGVRSN